MTQHAMNVLPFILSIIELAARKVNNYSLVSSSQYTFHCNLSTVAASKKKNSNEPVLYKRERNKINSLARVLQLENALYNDETVTRFADISDQINNVDKKIEGLRLDMQAAIHNEFMYLVNKMLLTKSKQQQHYNNDNSAQIDYGARQ
jgi:hypothetical protein